jgi:hypothetical protein
MSRSAPVRGLLPLLFAFLPLPLLAQETTPGEAAAGLAMMGGCMFFVLAIIAINILILIWVYNDARARGVESPAIWLLVVFFTGLIGLIIYLVVRPKGITGPCPSCGKKRMAGLIRCPHCGNP